MFSSTALTLAMLITTLVGLAVLYFVGNEIAVTIREFIDNVNRSERPQSQQTRKRAPHDTGPLDENQVIQPYQNRQTVERLITYFKDDEETKSATENEIA